MQIEELLRKARDGWFGPVHILVGTERFLLDRAVALLRAACAKDGLAGLNEDIFQGANATASTIVSAARTLPMMARSRFILVKDVSNMADAELDALANYLEAPVPSACLVLTAEKLDGRSRFSKSAKKQDFLTEALPLKHFRVRDFVVSEAKTRGHAIDADAAAALVDAIGADLSALDDALERLSLYVGKGAAIDLGAIESCVARVRVESIWALVDAVSARDLKKALGAAASLLRDREPALRILAMVSRQLRMVARMRQALASGLSSAEATKAAGAPPFKSGELTEAARRFTMPELRTAFSVLAEADLMLKSSKRPSEVILEEALLRLCRTG